MTDYLILITVIFVLAILSSYGLIRLINWEEERRKRLTWKEVWKFFTTGSVQEKKQ
jgi:hypothetical protein